MTTARYFIVRFEDLEESTREESMWTDYYEVLPFEGGYQATLYWWNDSCTDPEDYIDPVFYGFFGDEEQAIQAFYS